MKLSTWLKFTDTLGLTLIVWTDDQIEFNEEEPLYTGSSLALPWYIADMKISWKHVEMGDRPISFRNSLGEKYNNKPGFVILVGEE